MSDKRSAYQITSEFHYRVERVNALIKEVETAKEEFLKAEAELAALMAYNQVERIEVSGFLVEVRKRSDGTVLHLTRSKIEPLPDYFNLKSPFETPEAEVETEAEALAEEVAA